MPGTAACENNLQQNQNKLAANVCVFFIIFGTFVLYSIEIHVLYNTSTTRN